MHFYPRSPCGERPEGQRPEKGPLYISIHALLAESDPMPFQSASRPSIFLSTLSLRRATHPLEYRNQGRQFLSTLSLRRATCSARCRYWVLSISIHALLAESDAGECVPQRTKIISIHALLAESDRGWTLNINGAMQISIHALLAESDEDMVLDEQIEQISIHALLAESDLWVLRKVPLLGIFLSTLSLRRATACRGWL